MNSSNLKTAFVFSGGASLGAVEAGALKAVVEHGVQADMVFGTSVGSLNGAMYAYNPTLDGVKAIQDVWNTIKVWNVFSPSPITPVINFTTAGQYAISPKNLRKLIAKKLPFTNIEETKIPLYIVSTDIKCGEEVVFNKGLAIEALMSSVCLPGVFPPQHMHNRMLVDGGMLNNTPISAAVRLGAERIVIFPIGVPSSDQEPKNIFEILIRMFIYLLNRQLASDIQLYKDKVELIIVPPPDHIDVGPHDFSKSKILMEQSYQVAKKWLVKEGFKSNPDKLSHPCDVHTPPINLMEAVVPAPEKKASTRVKENIQETTHQIKESLDEAADDIYTGLVKRGEKLREKISTKKDKKELDE